MSEELEGVKAEMDEKGTSMTDAGPLVRVKQALTRIKGECTQMDIRIGVVGHVTEWRTLYYSLAEYIHVTRVEVHLVWH